MRKGRPFTRDRLDLTNAIEAAFADVTLGTGLTLDEAEALDRYESIAPPWERSPDRESRWQDIPDETLRDRSGVHSFQDDDGYLFHLPAFMCWIVRHHGQRDDHSGYAYSTIYSLGAYNEPRWLTRFRLLSEEQNRAVCRFLRFLDGQGEADATRSLSEYWGKFCSGPVVEPDPHDFRRFRHGASGGS